MGARPNSCRGFSEDYYSLKDRPSKHLAHRNVTSKGFLVNAPNNAAAYEPAATIGDGIRGGRNAS